MVHIQQLLGFQAIMPDPTPIASFRNHVFGNQSKDTELGQYTDLLIPFLVDVKNYSNNLGPYILRSKIVAWGESLDTLFLATLHDVVAKVYL